MPWCEHCSKFWSPPSMEADGSCPSCGSPIATAEPSAPSSPPSAKAPWHFKLMVVAVVLYLGWRLVQMIGWLL